MCRALPAGCQLTSEALEAREAPFEGPGGVGASQAAPRPPRREGCEAAAPGTAAPLPGPRAGARGGGARPERAPRGGRRRGRAGSEGAAKPNSPALRQRSPRRTFRLPPEPPEPGQPKAARAAQLTPARAAPPAPARSPRDLPASTCLPAAPRLERGGAPSPAALRGSPAPAPARLFLVAATPLLNMQGRRGQAATRPAGGHV